MHRRRAPRWQPFLRSEAATQNGAHLQDEQLEIAQPYMLSMLVYIKRPFTEVSAGCSVVLEAAEAKAGFASGGALLGELPAEQRCLLFF